MSSIPLISHHLFVAAVKDKRCARPTPGSAGPASEPGTARVREIQMELLRDGYQVPDEGNFPANLLFWTGST